jgi:two-component system LytT family sensor kinase
MADLRSRTLLLVAAGPLLGVLQVGGIWLAGRLMHEVAPFSTYLWCFVAWSCWSLFLPLIAWLAEHRPIAGGSRVRVAWKHLRRALGISVCLGLFFLGLNGLFRLFGASTFDVKRVVAVELSGGTLNDVLIYGVLVFTLSVFSYQERLRARELQASRLETLLARAELDLLRSQLDPHFVFNALHTISALIRRDPPAAERIVSRLGELLRLSLEAGSAQEVPVWRELELLFAYLEIQRERFGERLQIECLVPPEALGAVVPHLILQPLVENLIKHACERSGDIRATVSIGRAESDLVLAVRDDGPGFPADVLAGRREGIGLSNSRRRLEKLYGAEPGHRLRLTNLAGGGALVTVIVPWQTESQAPAEPRRLAGAPAARPPAAAPAAEKEVAERCES